MLRQLLFYFICRLSVRAVTIEEVQFHGNDKTSEGVLMTALGDIVGIDLSEKEIAKEISQRIQNIRNLNIFESVTHELVDRQLKVNLVEKWTVIPLLQFNVAGNTSQIRAGGFDTNFLGQYWELGGIYDYLNGLHAGVFWFYDKQFLNFGSELGHEFWLINNIQSLYDEKAELKAEYVRRGMRIKSFYEFPYRENLKLGFALSYENMGSQESGLPNESIDDNRKNSYHIVGGRHAWLIPSVYVEWGQIDSFRYIFEGFKARVDLSAAISETDPFFQFDLETLANFRISQLGYFSFRTYLNWKTSANSRHLLSAGSFEKIRGYYNGQFLGDLQVGANAELRWAFWDSKWFVPQGVIFADGIVNRNKGNPFLSESESYGASVGVGLRALVPAIDRFGLRLDYAFALTENAGPGINFGVNQFF